jgi:hypothetical protein
VASSLLTLRTTWRWRAGGAGVIDEMGNGCNREGDTYGDKEQTKGQEAK